MPATLTREGGCHPYLHETYEPDGSPFPCQGEETAIAGFFFALNRARPAVTERWGLQCLLRLHFRQGARAGDTDTDAGRKCPDVLVMGVQVNNPAQGVPATVQPVTSCRLLRPLRDGRDARENWRIRARAAQAASLAV
jgi:hypothetical protein